MALKKEVSYKGVGVEYWCITDTKVSWNKKGRVSTLFTLSGFVDQQARIDSLDNAIQNIDYVFPEVLDIVGCYAKLKAGVDLTNIVNRKQEVDFTDAVDC